jgi:hypothetical protein
MIIRDPIASMDQVLATIQRWSVMLGTIRDSLVVEGFTEEHAIDIARDWMDRLIEHVMECDHA